MNKNILFSILSLFLLSALPVFSQTYKTTADTVALNAEYIKVNQSITDLNAKLDKAKATQSKDEKKANEANSDAQSTASASSDKAQNAIGGSVKQAKKAKREARRSVRDAKNSRHAQSNVDDSNKAVAKLSADLEKQQQRLKELDEMRATIMNTQK
ncbi:MAG: hypothetical protein ABI172_11730 [Ginsengibacter sp.]